MKRSLWMTAVVTAIALAACGGGGATNDPAPDTATGSGGDAAHGAELYTATCASCHGPDAKGLPNLGKDLTAGDFMASTSDADLVAFIKVGRDGSDPANSTGIAMPPKGGNPALTDADLVDIVAYLRTLS